MRERWQPSLYFLLIVLGLVIGYVVAFAIKNSDETKVDFVFVTATLSLIWVMLLSLGIGLVAGVLLSQLYGRGGRKQLGKPGDSGADLGGPDEAVGEPR